MRRSIGRIVSVVTLVAAALMAAVATGGGALPAGAQAAGPQGEFTPVTPARILDTRSNIGQPSSSPVGHGGTIDLQVTGRGGVPSSGVSAVVMNVTAVSPTTTGYLTVYPAGTARPTISNVNFPAGSVVPNMVTVALGAGGGLQIYNAVGSTHVLADVVGYYADATGPAGSRFTSIPSYRRMDTRNNWGWVQHGPMTPGQRLSVQVTGQGNVPATGVTGVVMNVTVTAPTASGYLRITPEGGTSTTSSLNFVPGQVVPNLVTVPVPPSGVVDFYNPAGYTHVIADVVGYYGPAVGEAGRFIPIVPTRAYDSRYSQLGALPPATYDIIPLGWWGGVPADIVDAAVLNVTVTQPTESGFLTVADDDVCEFPLSSNLNFTAGQTVANQVVTGLSSPNSFGCYDPAWWPAADFLDAVGWTHYIVDIFGYFTNANGGVGAVADSESSRSGAAQSNADRGPVVRLPADSATKG